jgi:acetate kinase
MDMGSNILMLNAGPSSFKFWFGAAHIYVVATDEERMIAEHAVEHTGQAALPN